VSGNALEMLKSCPLFRGLVDGIFHPTEVREDSMVHLASSSDTLLLLRGPELSCGSQSIPPWINQQWGIHCKLDQTDETINCWGLES
jgi:hypothetical protein